MSDPKDNQYTIFEQEAQDRNSILIGKYNKIPSYALWIDYDIEKESLEKRIAWWENYINSDNELFKNTALFWLKLLKAEN
tara:strand:- start:486 stop:725 length:240 start_codon:yes stop_codon:yes gene_type:complete